jgi:hypothetical protein
MAFTNGPYVQVAAICENAIQDNTGVWSLIRLIDTLTSTAQGETPPESMPPITANLKLVIMLKSGEARGRYDLKMVPNLPSGETMNVFSQSVQFEGDERGHAIVLNFVFTFPYEGVYWFRIYLSDEEITAIPFRIKYERIVLGSPKVG